MDVVTQMDIEAALNTYHNRMAAHKLASTCPDEWEKAAMTAGGDLNLARKPDSTWQSKVLIFREQVPIFTNATGQAALYFGKLLEDDVEFAVGSADAGGATTAATTVPTDLTSRSFYWRNIGSSYKFTPTLPLDQRGGEIGMLAFTGPVATPPSSIQGIRDYPWGEVVSYNAGAHLDVAHGRCGFTFKAIVQGGYTATTYDAHLPIHVPYDPDEFIMHDGAGVLFAAGTLLEDNNMQFSIPVSAIGPAVIRSGLQLQGVACMALTVPQIVAATNIGTLETLRIIEVCLPSQLLASVPITSPMKPGTLAGRKSNQMSDLQYIVHKSEGALGWLGKNWRGVAKTALDIADVGTSIGSALSIPGVGAADQAVGFLKGFF